MLTLDPKAINKDKGILHQTKVPIGGQLSNHSTLLAESDAVRFPGEVITSIVLAVASGGYQPFVVWTRCRDMAEGHGSTKIVDYCIQGNYYRSLPDALAAFNKISIERTENCKSRNQLTINQLNAELLKVMDNESGRTP